MSRTAKLTQIKCLHRLVRPAINLDNHTRAYRRILSMSDDELDALLTKLEMEAGALRAAITARRAVSDDEEAHYRYSYVDTSLPLGNQGCGGGQRIIRKQGGLM